MPEGEDFGMWAVTASDLPMQLPRWKATFDSDIPVEAIAAFTSEVATQVAAGNAGFLYSPFGDDPGWYPLKAASWRADIRGGEAAFTAPGGLARLNCVRGELSYAGEMGPGPWAWTLTVGQGRYPSYATLTGGTPPRLVAAFTNAISDPAPVIRTKFQVPLWRLAHLHATPATEAAEPAESRARAATARTVHPTGPTPTEGGPPPPITPTPATSRRGL